MYTSWEPALTIGSIARVIPVFRFGGVPGTPKLGTWGSSCIWLPIPWPTNCRWTRKPAGPDQPVGDGVQLDRLDPRLARLLEGREHGREQAARPGHEVDLVGCFQVDHAVCLLPAGAVTAARTWRLMSSIVPMPSISETRPSPR